MNSLIRKLPLSSIVTAVFGLAVVGPTLVWPALAEDAAAPAAPIAAPSLEGSYKGTLVCARFPEQLEVLRVPLDVIVSGKSVKFSRPIENGRGVVGNEMGEGTLDGGSVTLSSGGTSFGAHFEAKYSGVMTADGGTLTGAQSWSASGTTRTRPCTAAFVKSL